jgi:signal recognition particle receptor subunit beta
MVQFNFARKEVSCKLVYYGPGMSGKTTNIENIHHQAPDTMKGQLTSIATEGDRTLFFDFLPLDLGEIAGMRTKFQLYTVPGQVYYDSTRKLVLQGADGIVFVADSNPAKRQENVDSLRNLEENLREYGVDLNNFPLVIQYNKRDLPDAMDISVMDQEINHYEAPSHEAVACKGEGVMATLKLIAKMVLDRLNEEYASGRAGARAVATPPPALTPSLAAAHLPSQAEVPVPSRAEAPAAAPAASASPPVTPPPSPPRPVLTPPAAKPAVPPPPAPARPTPVTAAAPTPPAGPTFIFAKGSSRKGAGCKKAAAVLLGLALAVALALLVAAIH